MTGTDGWQSLTGPIFNETNFLPGSDVIRYIRVTNYSGQTQRIAIEAINKNDHDNLASQMDLVIKQGATPIFNNTLKKFFDQGETYLSDLGTGLQTIYDLTITFKSDANDDYQGKALGFDIVVGFEGTEGGLILPLSGQGTNEGGEDGLPDGLTIKYEAPRNVSSDSAEIVWLTSYKSTSRVIYDINPSVFNLNSLPNYGYAFSTDEQDTPANLNGVTYHDVWLTGLEPGTTYYYRCISHASPDTVGLEASFKTLKNGSVKIVYSEPTPEQEKSLVTGRGNQIAVGGSSDNGQVSEEPDSAKKETAMEGIAETGKGSGADSNRFLAAIGLMPFDWKFILILAVIIGLVLIVIGKKKK
ncbi:MAG: hypothetical protein E4H16_02930 [Candidatus Atribacteria bacterium]|nr:MAG: hypothetical protein E4H16_02930 [Candidatus Atribacteria bacterium]